MAAVRIALAAFPHFALSEDHEELRQAVRSLAEDKIAPHAAEADEKAEFPRASYDALVASDFHAPHIPEEYDGVGPTRSRPASSSRRSPGSAPRRSLIPAVNKLGTMPLILAASDDVKRRYLPPVARGRGDVLLRPVRAGGGQRHGVHAHAGPGRDGDDWILDGQKSWISNAGVSRSTTPSSPSPTPTVRAAGTSPRSS